MNLIRVVINDIAVYSICGLMLYLVVDCLAYVIKNVKRSDWSAVVIGFVVACIAGTVVLSMKLV